jgi:hypothetical protein
MGEVLGCNLIYESGPLCLICCMRWVKRPAA